MKPHRNSGPMVKYYDPGSSTVTSMSKSQLPAGCIPVRLEGVGIVWTPRPAQKPLIHPPFTGERRAAVEAIQETFSDVYPRTFTQWEEGFRRNHDPDTEIRLWQRMASHFVRACEGRSEIEKRDVYLVILACSLQPREFVPQSYRTKIKELPLHDAEVIVQEWFSGG